MAGKFWTQEEDNFLKNNYINLTPKEMAEKLNRTRKAIWSRMATLGLEKPEPKVGDKYGKLTIKEIYNEFNGKQNKTMVKCDCDCGTKLCIGILSQIVNEYKSSCGCLSGCHNKRDFIERGEDFAHGLRQSRLYRIWYGMKSRCTNPKSDYNNRYINRGITLCEEWKDFKTFKIWAFEKGYTEEGDCSLERKDVDKNYCPDNCKWIPKREQSDNKNNSKNILITAFGETKSSYVWVRDIRCKVTHNSLLYRINAGWDHERAITQIAERDKKLGLENWVRKHHPEIVERYHKFYA